MMRPNFSAMAVQIEKLRTTLLFAENSDERCWDAAATQHFLQGLAQLESAQRSMTLAEIASVRAGHPPVEPVPVPVKPAPQPAPLTTLIEAMQRMQASYRALAKTERTEGGEPPTANLVVVVLGDLIRLAAELRAGDGERANITASTPRSEPSR